MESISNLKKTFGLFEIIEYEDWNKKYEGLIIRIKSSGLLVRCRLAKKTPKKEGYFTAFWEKNEFNQNIPFNSNSAPDILAVVISDSNKNGVFVLPKEIAISYKILSTLQSNGKMSMRFYPDWCSNLNKIAKSTQNWQLKYFKKLS